MRKKATVIGVVLVIALAAGIYLWHFIPGSTSRNPIRITMHLGLRPEIKVLYMSGFTNKVIVQDALLAPGTAFLEKPFTPGVLASKVREVLDVTG